MNFWAATELAAKGVESGSVKGQYYWSSSEFDANYVWRRQAGNANRYPVHRTSYSSAVRCFMFLKDFFNSSVGNEVPKVGDVVYEDKTFGAASDYDGTKRAVGVVAIVSEDARDVTIINLKGLILMYRL